MKQLVYIGPDLIFNFLQRRPDPSANVYDAIVKVAGVKFCVVVQFEMLQAQYKDKVGPVECGMSVSFGSVAGAPVGLEALNKATHCLTLNSKMAGEICCQAFLNGFLDTEF